MSISFGDCPIIIPASAYRDNSTPVHTYNPANPGMVVLGNSVAPIVIPISALSYDTLTSFSVNVVKNSSNTNTLTARMERSRALDGATTTVATATNNANNPGSIILAPPASFHENIDAGYGYHILVWNSNAAPSAPDYILFTVVNRLFRGQTG